MSAEYARRLQASRSKGRNQSRMWRARAVLALGPLTAAAGIVWAIAQPWRITLLHPFGQGFWWLVSEPPIYVVLAGIGFRLFVAPGIVADLEAEDG